MVVYDNETSELWLDGEPVVVDPINPIDYSTKPPANRPSIENPSRKSRDVDVLKIQLGFSCNYSCNYCSQKFVEAGDQTNVVLVSKFLLNVRSWMPNAPSRIEIWGGEPFVYWKLMKPLVAGLKKIYPTSRFTTITNGSLLTDEIVDWLVENEFAVSISHDGPGQSVRGPDPLQDPEKARVIRRLFAELLPRQAVSFNSMCHRTNYDREKIRQFFVDFLGHSEFAIGEGAFITAYDPDGRSTGEMTLEEKIDFRNLTLHQARNLDTWKQFLIMRNRLTAWVDSFGNARPATSLGQGCSMENEHVLAVDLRGNIITCQNVTAFSTAENGMQHKIGHVSNIEGARLNTVTHWSHRPNCSGCPVVQMCRGNCMFLEGQNFEASCETAYNDHVPFFAVAIEMATGVLPYEIHPQEGNLPIERRVLWSLPRSSES